MSIVVGVEYKDEVALASDSIVSDNLHRKQSVPWAKLWRGGSPPVRAVGFTGGLWVVGQWADFLAWHEGHGSTEDGVRVADPKRFDTVAGVRSVFTSFDGWLRSRCPWLLNGREARDGEPLWSDNAVLVACRAGLLDVDAQMCVMRHDVWAIGVGAHAAMACVRTLRNAFPEMTAEALAKRGVEHVLEHYTHVAGPVTSITIGREGKS